MYYSLRVFSAAICFCVLTFPAHAAQIQMLPPVTEASKDSPSPEACPGGTASSLLTWDGKTPIACADGVDASGGNISATGSIKPGSFTKGTACPTEGALGYDIIAHTPVHCSNQLVWVADGWISIPLSDTTPFDVNCQYKLVWGNAAAGIGAEYATDVTAGRIAVGNRCGNTVIYANDKTNPTIWDNDGGCGTLPILEIAKRCD